MNLSVLAVLLPKIKSILSVGLNRVKFNREDGSGSSPNGLTDRPIYFYIGP